MKTESPTSKPRNSWDTDSERSADMRRIMIAEAAFYRAECRGFCGGAEDTLHDWLEAEAEIDQRLLMSSEGVGAR
jgi:hypothetical protein